MSTYDDYLPSPTPFWFASEGLLTDILRVEIDAVNKLLAGYPNLSNIFDDHDATVPQRTLCFELLARRELMAIVYEMFAGRHEQSPSLGDSESKALSGTQNLVARDAPAWAREVNDVVELLPYRINVALPKPLRKGRYDANDPAQAEALKSLSSVERIQRLTRVVLDQQLRRLAARWSSTTASNNQFRPDQPPVEINSELLNQQKDDPKKRKALRTQDKVRVLRDKMIAAIDDVAKTPTQFLEMMDERKVMHLPTWAEWPGTWIEAYKNPRLRELIHKDKSRSIKRARNRHNR
jgi:hypothetical protein